MGFILFYLFSEPIYRYTCMGFGFWLVLLLFLLIGKVKTRWGGWNCC